jgi:TetR/AcrR family transcriptional regulator, transcriptional repressor for nem operon
VGVAVEVVDPDVATHLQSLAELPGVGALLLQVAGLTDASTRVGLSHVEHGEGDVVVAVGQVLHPGVVAGEHVAGHAGGSTMGKQLTAKVLATRQRIVRSGAELVYRRGATATSLDDILEHAGAGKSQLYHYFDGRDDLEAAIAEHQVAFVLALHEPHLAELDSFAALNAWFDQIVETHTALAFLGGCPVGSLANEIADRNEAARDALLVAFDTWRRALVTGFATMQQRGELRSDAEPAALANAVIASIQGGILLARIHREGTPLRDALDQTLRTLRAATV